ncbi:hypothetical protein FE773_04645 [Caminibacter mediatlanticus TB-2]|uniref:Uncharacterized protein n=1 Tax=Caminibacter mediatlanticus TB-2 TaxID=391592 RepID=A0AAI9F1N2_9BACT|nr:hypothetical protein [Caminibacter mediatlanticus]EDM22924.1 hypothetical protein CMTB2_07790 [Caminibacter mediatlanticus TB-2]QCT94493.1 hypothetical protein FE773_04645 [Caminibacter mediatlanticus TB-2]
MKKLLFFILSIVLAFSFEMVNNKNYKCEAVSITIMDGNQTRNIPVTPKTKELIKKTLKMFYNIEAKRNNNTVNLTVGKINEDFNYFQKWKNYNQYINKDKSIIFMPDKDKNSTNVALIIPGEKLIIFYKCK